MAFRDPRLSTAARWAPLLVTTIIVLTSSRREEGWLLEAASVVAVLALFDVGPWLASKLFGLPAPQLLLPFWRGRASPASTEPWKLGLALLLGPLPITCWGVGLAVVSLALDVPALLGPARVFGLTSIVTLLPLAPAAGGVLLRLVVFSRWPRLEQAFAVVSGAGMGLLGLSAGSNVLAAIGFVFALGAFSWGPTLVEASKLRAAYPVLSSRRDELGEPETGALFLAADRTEPPARQRRARAGGVDAERVGALYAARMRSLHERAVLRPPRVASSAALLALYLVGLVATVVLLALAYDRPEGASSPDDDVFTDARLVAAPAARRALHSSRSLARLAFVALARARRLVRLRALARVGRLVGRHALTQTW